MLFVTTFVYEIQISSPIIIYKKNSLDIVILELKYLKSCQLYLGIIGISDCVVLKDI